MQETGINLLKGLLEPAEALVDPSKRVFAPFLLGSAVLACAVLLVRGVALRSVAGHLFSPRIWLHRSSRLDFQLIAAKALLRVVLFGSYTLSTLAVAALTAGWLRRQTASSAPLHWSPWLVAALFTLGAFLVEDWSRWLVHKWMHRVPVLWEIHKVHHSAEVLTPFTLYRTHPGEALLNGARGALSVGAMMGLFIWLFGPAVRAWEILGVDLIGFVWTLFGANLRHSHVWVSYGRWWEHLLISPAQHQIHHSRDPRHYDRNFGAILAVWDWLGGSLYTTRAREPIQFGLPDGEPDPGRSVVALLLTPLLAVARRLARPAWRVALIGLALLSISCSEKNIDRTALLQSFGQCTLESYQAAKAPAAALDSAAKAYAAAPADDTRLLARTAWANAIDAWEVVELLIYGPAADATTPGGQGLRPFIYSWPLVDTCLIDQQLVSKGYQQLATLDASARGLGAIEYLLFHDGANGCTADNPINTDGSWAAITDLQQRKADYASAAAADVSTRVAALVDLWEKTGGFREQLVAAGRGSTLFASQKDAINTVAAALYHFDTEVKDAKLGEALNYGNCLAMPCTSALESQWARRTRTHLRNNLAGLRVLLEGCTRPAPNGFDDLLESAGVSQLAAEMKKDLTAVAASIDALPTDDVGQTLAADRPAVQRVYDAVKEITDFLKMEFKTALQITTPGRVEGDTD
jgi:sterol desaturase/sphingolipid hydroxylase (fatty acid hydroxylase superfamily)/predicted lipoprotein